MVSNELKQPESNFPKPIQGRTPAIVGLSLLSVLFIAGGYFVFNSPRPGDCFEEQELQSQDFVPDFRKWEKPEVAIVLTGQMHGFIDKCGCSDPQYGGLPRRYNFVQTLKEMKWDVVGIDLGEVAKTQGIHAQNLLKFDLALKSLGLMNYRAVAMGKNEILSPLGEALAQAYDKNRLHPRPIALSLTEAEPGALFHDELNLRQWEIITTTTPKIGVTSLMGPDMVDQLKNHANVLSNLKELPKALKAFADAGVEIGIILHHEHPNVSKDLSGFERMKKVEAARLAQAKKCAEFCEAERRKNPKVPPIMLMMVLTDEPEAPSLMRPIGGNLPSQVVEIGHKGKYVGLVGVYRDRKGYRLQYQTVRMGPEWESKKGEENNNQILALMENYNNELKRQNMLAKYPRTPHYNQLPNQGDAGLKATFVGSERCMECHQEAAKAWTQETGKLPAHAKATETLENLKFPAGRQYDPECMKCHTTGFSHPGGYNDLVVSLADWPKKPANPINPKKITAHNESLRGVGCESCHGPGSAHVKKTDDKAIHALMNPFKITQEERKWVALLEKNPGNPQIEAALKKLYQNNPAKRQMADMCSKCHDHENDVHWGQPGYDLFDKWIGKKLYHHTARNNDGGAIQPNPKEKGVGVVPMVEPPPFSIEVLKDEPKKKPR